MHRRPPSFLQGLPDEPRYARALARRDGWTNARLHAAAAAGPDEAARRRDPGAFFGSLHRRTPEHLVRADTVWLARIQGRSLVGLGRPGEPLSDGFAAMRARREALPGEMADWTGTLTRNWRAADSVPQCSTGRAWTRPAWLRVTHLLDHQIHHRGRATTPLTQPGADPGVTDLPAMPA